MRYVELNRDSIEQALNEWSPRQAGAGVVALLPEAAKDHLPVLQAACREYHGQRGLRCCRGGA
ncbi:MAG: hypothetical protein WBK19_02190 [Azonexus sp.]